MLDCIAWHSSNGSGVNFAVLAFGKESDARARTKSGPRVSRHSRKLSVTERAATRPRHSRGTFGAANAGKSAVPDPLFEASAKFPRAVELDLAVRERGSEREISHPDARERLEIGRHEQVDLVAGVGRAQIDLGPVAHDPPVPVR